MEFPKHVDVIEVGPRDGFQNIKDMIDTSLKIEVIEKIIASGIQEMELTSFVHPKKVPQMSDAKEVAIAILSTYADDLHLFALVPNIKGAENALSCGIKTVSYVISASEAHNIANINRTVEQSCDELRELTREYPELNVRLDIGTAFGCPFKKTVPIEDVLKLADKASSYGVAEIVFCDTIGIANPRQVSEFCKLVKGRYMIPTGFHLHDTRGWGLANTVMAMKAGFTRFETSIGGLGGCPFAPGAAGNTASEDMLGMLDEMKIHTGVDLKKYMKAVETVHSHIQQDLTGHLYKVCQAARQQEEQACIKK